MKKLVLFTLIFLIFILALLYFTYGKDFLALLDEKKVYKIENMKTTELDTLEEYIFFNKGILSYNNQKFFIGI